MEGILPRQLKRYPTAWLSNQNCMGLKGGRNRSHGGPTINMKCSPFANRNMLIFVIVLLVITTTGSVHPQSPPKTLETLKTTASAMLDAPDSSKSVSVIAPELSIKEHVLKFDSGDARPLAKVNPELTKFPWRSPFHNLLRIELLRRYLGLHNQDALAFWSATLVAAEGEVDNSIKEIQQSNKAQPELERYLIVVDARITQMLQETARIYAAKQKLTLEETDEVRGKKVKVTFVIEPQEAELRIIGVFYYRIAKGQLPDTAWKDVSHGNSVQIDAGDWEYQARWDPKTPWQSGVLPIYEDGKQKIKKKPQ